MRLLHLSIKNKNLHGEVYVFLKDSAPSSLTIQYSSHQNPDPEGELKPCVSTDLRR